MKACLKANSFISTRQTDTDIGSQLSTQVAAQQHRTKQGILSIIDIIISLEQRGIPLRGDWDKSKQAEDGNFAFFVDWKSKFDRSLQEHIQYAPENAKYTSPAIQNEIINLCEKCIRQNILESIPKYWSIMADKTQDFSTTEQVSLCVCYVNRGNEICEEFPGFIRVSRMDAEVSIIQQWGLDTSYLVSQGYDGASVMSSSKNGVKLKHPTQMQHTCTVVPMF